MIKVTKKITFLLFAFCISISSFAAGNYYVTVIGAGNKLGSGWTNGISSEKFFDTLENATSGDIFYVATGVYYPVGEDAGGGWGINPDNISSAFILNQGVSIIGSFHTNLTDTSHDLVTDITIINAYGELQPTTIFFGDLDNNGVNPANGDAAILLYISNSAAGAPVIVNGIELTTTYARGITGANTNIELESGGWSNAMGNDGFSQALVNAYLGDRDWEIFTTTLSGDIGNSGTITDNCYHVIISAQNERLKAYNI